MDGSDSTRGAPAPARGGTRAAKRSSVIAAARQAFARDGYTRASIDAIGRRAEVSTRTIYNHFPSKGDLFAAVLLDGADRVADAFDTQVAQTVDAHPREELIALCRAFVDQQRTLPEHFALVAQLRADIEHVPHALVADWHRRGPLRIQATIARRLDRLRDEGELRIAEPHRAALHLIALATAESAVRPPGAPQQNAKALDEAMVAGVDAFLDGYGRRRQ